MGNVVSSFSYLSEQSNIVEKFKEIAFREKGKGGVSKLIMEYITKYVENHTEGNPNFEITKWQDNAEFKAMPSLMDPHKNWTKFIRDDTDKKERNEIKEMANHILFQIQTAEKKEQIDKATKLIESYKNTISTETL